MYPICLSLLRNGAPCGLSGLIAEMTSCIPSSRLTVFSTASLSAGSVSFPSVDLITSGLLP